MTDRLTDDELDDLLEAHKPLQDGKGPEWCAVCEPLDCYVARLATEVKDLRAWRDEMEKRKDGAYLERNQVVQALSKCFPSGVARTSIEGWSEDWHGCVYIDLPTGQASWHFHDSQAYLFEHLPPYTKPWDGHTTEEKYRRLAALEGTR